MIPAARSTASRILAVAFKLLFALFIAWVGAACTLRIGGPNKLPGAGAPTAIPLSEGERTAVLTQSLALPPGFTISIFAQGLDQPRMLAIGPDGQAYVAERGAGRIVRLPDLDRDSSADRLQVVAQGLQAPSSLAFYQDGSLYVGETTRILRLSDPDPQGVFLNQAVIVAGLPEGGHNTRTLLFSPDWEKLYVSIGSSCNACYEADLRRATIMQYNPDGSGEVVFARGLRNAVGITFRPGTHELWATNNGCDMLGDDLPPDTIQAVRQGQNFGWPRCHSGRFSDPELGGSAGCKEVSPPDVELQAHSAPLGLTFYSGSQFPSQYQGNLFVAFHGSWNRSQPTGYKIVRIQLKGGQPGPVEDFVTGWLRGGSAWGRPVDLVIAPDGSLLVSDDGGGIIYRIAYLEG